MSVALLMTLTSLVLRLVWVALCLPGVAKRPVPRDTTHSRGVPGHRHWHSWMANAVGLLISRPPSYVNVTLKERTCYMLHGLDLYSALHPKCFTILPDVHPFTRLAQGHLDNQLGATAEREREREIAT